jgi:hypothetical protein
VTVYRVEPISRSLMAAFVAAHHYAVRVPPQAQAEDTPERAAAAAPAEVAQ